MQDLRLQTGVYNNNNNSYNNNNIIIIVPKIDIINFSRYVSSLNSNDHERRYSNTDCSRLPSAGGRLRSSSTHSRRRRCRRLFRGGRWGRGKSPPPPRRRVRARPRYTFVHTRRRAGRVCHHRRPCGSSVQSTRQNGYSLLYDTHSVLSVRFLLIAVLFLFVFFFLRFFTSPYFLVSRNSASFLFPRHPVSLTDKRKRIGSRRRSRSTL